MSEVPLQDPRDVRMLHSEYRGTSLIRNSAPKRSHTAGLCLGLYGGARGGGLVMSEVTLQPLYRGTSLIRNSPPPGITIGP